MITAETIMEKLGKEKGVEFILKNKSKEKTGAERDRGVKGRVKHRRCSHGVWVIENYEVKNCKDCSGVESGFPGMIIHSQEYFNIGTGTFGTETDHRKAAKGMGLVPTA